MSIDQAKIICKDMMGQRGYNVVSENEECILVENKEESVLLFFDESPKLNKTSISNYISVMNDKNVKHSVIVYTESVTTMTSKSVEQTIDIDIELFSRNELQFNITKHRLQPISFEKLSKSESDTFKKNYGVQLPVMRKSDQISRFYNFSSGDLIKVTDKRGIVSHRIVKN
jgi:DNA-directed RNA polymerase subunit H (RpoH/RPB5)